MEKKTYNVDDICIVGIGCVLPDARNPKEFWKNIIEGNRSIKPIPDERWKKEIYVSQNKKEEDKVYSNLAGFVDDTHLKKISHKLKIDYNKFNRLQIMSLEAASQAISCIDKKILQKKKISLILGCTDQDENISLQKFLVEEESLKKHISKNISESKTNVIRLLKTYFSSMKKKCKPKLPTLLTMSITKIIKERYNFKAESCIIDAACASSLAAIDIAKKKLRSKKADLIIIGGIESHLGPEIFLLFCKGGAYAKKGCYPFDKRSDGLILGEGAVFFVMERLEDALKAKHKIFGVIKSCTSSSDGNKGSLFSPTSLGQLKAMSEAYKEKDSNNINYVECHGTGTKIGDVTELTTLSSFFKNNRKVPIGSVKSLIGHTRGAAGAVGMLKCILSIKYKIIPPSPYFQKFPKNTGRRLYVNKTPVSLKTTNRPLIFGVSSFGFGGINYHLALEEFIEKNKVENKKETKKKEIVVIGTSYILPGKVKKYFKDNNTIIPPNSLPQIDLVQLQAVIAASKAMTNTKLFLNPISKNRVSVISASCLGLKMTARLSKRVRHLGLVEAFHTLPKNVVNKIIKHRDKFAPITEDSGPGVLNNVIAGRICNLFDFKGKNFNVDADMNSFPCALNISSLELQSGESDIVILVGIEEKIVSQEPSIKRNGMQCLILTTREYANSKKYDVLSNLKHISYKD